MFASTSAFHEALQLPHSVVVTRRNRALYSMPVATTLDVFEGAPRGDSTILQEWALNYGVQTCHGFFLQSDHANNRDPGGTDQDVFAVSINDMPAESPILYVPGELIWTGNSVMQQELGVLGGTVEQVLGYDTSIVAQFCLFCKVLREYQNMESPWRTWLNAMPRFYSNGASMTDFCFGCLPPYAMKLALQDKKQLETFQQALEHVPAIHVQDQDAMKWAYNVVMTRSLPLPNGDYALVPLADYFNHGGVDRVNVEIGFDETGGCYAYSTRTVPADTPLLMSYGDSTNPSELLARYGFLDDSATATYCKYVIDRPSQQVVTMGYPQDMVFYQDGGIGVSVWDVLLYDAVLSPQDQQAFYQAFLAGDEPTRQHCHEQNFAQTLRVLRKHVNFLMNELEELEMGIETQAKRGTHFFRYPRLPLLLKHNEFVKNIMEKVQLNVDGMG
jgi:hypothetical protein